MSSRKQAVHFLFQQSLSRLTQPPFRLLVSALFWGMHVEFVRQPITPNCLCSNPGPRCHRSLLACHHSLAL